MDDLEEIFLNFFDIIYVLNYNLCVFINLIWIALLLQHPNIPLCPHPHYGRWIRAANTNPDQRRSSTPRKIIDVAVNL
jgi:hypothetical protein